MWQTQELLRRAKAFAVLADQAEHEPLREQLTRVASSCQARAEAHEWLVDEKIALQPDLG